MNERRDFITIEEIAPKIKFLARLLGSSTVFDKERSMNERTEAINALHLHASLAKQEIEAVLDILGWPFDPALSQALDRLTKIKEGTS